MLRAAALMVATGIGFAFAAGFTMVVAVALVGTPPAGSVSVFGPLKQSLLSPKPRPVARAPRSSLAHAFAG